VIREASPSDAERFRDLRLFALQESPTAFGADHQANAARPPEYWREWLKKEETSAIFFAEHDHDLIGMMGIEQGYSPKTRHSSEIWGVFVLPDWRGLHIAEALINASVDWARSKNIVIVKLGVLKASESAIRCYQRCGFTIYGTEPQGMFYNGTYYDGYLMSRSVE
jgi:RimJ/RimL family protein N-acetyltransferase